MIASLETERLILRQWRPTDREPFACMNADPAVMEFFPACLSRAESDQGVDGVERHFRERGFGLFAAELRRDGTFIGFIGLNVPRFVAHFTPCVEIGWRLAAAYWGQGLATEGARAALSHGLEKLDTGRDCRVHSARQRAIQARNGKARDDARSLGRFRPSGPAGGPSLAKARAISDQANVKRLLAFFLAHI